MNTRGDYAVQSARNGGFSPWFLCPQSLASTNQKTMNTVGPFLTWNLLLASALTLSAADESQFRGAFFHGEGDVEYLRLLDTARRTLAPDPEFQNLAMLYRPSWNGLVEGPTWDAWWIQNSYGTTYSVLPFFEEPFTTFLQNSHDLWFDQIGDGQRVGAAPPFDWVAPDGCLCDAARPAGSSIDKATAARSSTIGAWNSPRREC